MLIGPNNLGLERVIPELEPLYSEVEFVHCADPERLAAELAEADIYLGWLSRDGFLAAKKIRWIQSPSSGVDKYLDIEELAEGDVILTSARGTHGACLAEHAFALILAFTRGIRQFVLEQQRHHWSNREWRASMRELNHSTLGIVGLGTVGRALALRARAFDMRVLAVDISAGEKPACVERLDSLEGLPHLLAESEYVVVTVPLTSKTRGMIGKRELTLMKPDALLVGISRGGVIDETALIAALQEGRLGAAALDVFEEEPLPEDSPLWDLPNVLITPHVAGGSQYESAMILDIFKENLGRFLRGEFPLRNQVDKHRGF